MRACLDPCQIINIYSTGGEFIDHIGDPDICLYFTTGTLYSHATPVIIQGLVILFVGYQIKQHASLLIIGDRLFFWVYGLPLYFPGGVFTLAFMTLVWGVD